MLNDLSQLTRRKVFVQGLSLGVVLAALVISNRSFALGMALIVIGFVLQIACPVAFAVVVRRAGARLVSDIEAASSQIVRREVASIPVAGRTVRRQIVKSTGGFLASSGDPLGGPTVLVVATALTDDGARRVAFLSPAPLALNLRNEPVALRLHPSVRDAAVLDDTIGPGELQLIGQDPRWASDELPTDRTVVGGWSALAGASVLGFLCGFGIDVVVYVLLT